MLSNEHIVACARNWIGTRFHHQGRVKKAICHNGGVDCLGLLIGVARELDLRAKTGIPLSALDVTDYSHYPDVNHLRSVLEDALELVPAEVIAPGNVALMNIDGNPQHLGIISSSDVGLGLIHAYAPARAVVEHAIDNSWLARIEAAFCISF